MARNDQGIARERNYIAKALVLMKMIQADYLLHRPCPSCGLRAGNCFNYFCKPCRTGGLCSTQFHANGSPHFRHESVRVFKISYQYVVHHTDMQQHFDTNLFDTSLVLKYISNNSQCCYLRTKQTQGLQSAVVQSSSQRRIDCAGCQKTFLLPRDPGIVCSVQCLLLYNRGRGPSFRYRPRKQSRPTRSPWQ